jgi:hypothetical protein
VLAKSAWELIHPVNAVLDTGKAPLNPPTTCMTLSAKPVAVPSAGSV